jgi:hypothetical protein
VDAELGGRHSVDAVVIPDMREQVLSGGLVDHPIVETLEIGKRLGVALPGCLGVTPDNLLETAVPGNEQASSIHPCPPATRCRKMACNGNDREGRFPFANGTPAGVDAPRLGDRLAPSRQSSRQPRRMSIALRERPSQMNRSEPRMANEPSAIEAITGGNSGFAGER